MTFRHACACAALLYAAAGRADAQIIAAKTTPLAEGDQFTFLPSANRGMAGVSIALRDTLLDPFTNPATGARLHRSYAFGSPSFYSLSHKGSNGSTLPLGIITHRAPYFATAAGAVQVVDPGGQNDFGGPIAINALAAPSVSLIPGAADRRSGTNRYLLASAGRTVRDSSWAVGASVQWARLAAVDGVDLLYPGATSLRQVGDNLDVRVGTTKDWATRAFEAVVVHERVATTHDVGYIDLFWDPGTRSVFARPRTDHNYDQRHSWGAKLRFEQLLSDSSHPGWRLGGQLSASRTTQPTAPVLGMMTLAGAPGTSSALNAGIGVSRTRGGMTAGMDAIYEPIWAEQRRSEGLVDQYRYGNALVRAGIGYDFALVPSSTYLRLQGGAQMHRIQYVMHEAANTATSVRSRQGWNEWTHTGSMSMRTELFEFLYSVGVVSGVERPGMVFNEPGGFVQDFAPAFPQVRMTAVRVVTQQFSFRVRLP